MNAHALHPGIEVEVDVRGTVFPARIAGSPAGPYIQVIPLVRNVSYRRIRIRQIKRILREAPSAGQLQLGGIS